MKLFHGSPHKLSVIEAGWHVTPQFERAVKYARYPGNGEGVESGFVYDLDPEEADILWHERSDCRQGELKRPRSVLRYTISNLPLSLPERDSPITIRPNGDFLWNGLVGKREIVWLDP